VSVLPPYPEYVNTGIDFLHQIPSDWTIRPAVTLARVLTSTVDKHTIEGEVPVRLCNYTDVYYNDMIRDEPAFMTASATPDQIASFAVEAGDVVFTKDSETADDIAIAAYVSATLPGVVYGYHLSTYRPHDIRYGKFLKWLLDSKYAKATFQTRTLGVTRVGLSQNTVRYFRVPTPPPDDAASIGEYLDRETAEIDAFIADQEKLIGLLAERRAATISHAVTKGLDPTVRTKDSGIEWIGSIPETWKVMSSRRVFVQRKQIAFDSDQQLAATQEFGVIPQAQYTSLTGNRVTVVLKGFDILKRVVPGDFVISMRSFQGGLEYSKYEGKISSAYVMLAAQVPIVDTFFRYLFKSRGYISALRATSNLVRDGQAMRFSNFTMVPIALPSLDEQQRIAAVLDSLTEQMDVVLADAREAIALSRERRAALISAAVTGKIDVREHGVVA
jgi:type I restriction enzyme S subunit